MKYLLHTFYLLTTLFFITSCGVDRSGEYYALVGDDMWIEEVMKQHYLWYDQIPEISEKDYFAEPEELFGTIHYLISDASSFVTGALSVVDGGFDAFSI